MLLDFVEVPNRRFKLIKNYITMYIGPVLTSSPTYHIIYNWLTSS